MNSSPDIQLSDRASFRGDEVTDDMAYDYAVFLYNLWSRTRDLNIIKHNKKEENHDN